MKKICRNCKYCVPSLSGFFECRCSIHTASEMDSTISQYRVCLDYIESGTDTLLCEEKETHKKPPLGLTPRYLHDDERRIHILEAMERYTLNDMAVPIEWIRELKDLEEKRG